jgi:GNAT superfamily N-acetyltransferase
VSEIAIRSAVAGDIDSLIGLMEQYWRYDGIHGFNETRIRLQLQAFFSMPTYGCGWVAEEKGGALAGYLLTTFIFSFEHGGLTAEVDELFVTEGSRGKKLGTQLLSAACMGLEEHGCVSLQMQVATDNEAARAFYSGRGFAEKGGYTLWVAPLNAVARGS